MGNRLYALLVVAALLICAAPARSGVLVDTFGPGNSYDAGNGWAVGNYLAPHPFDAVLAVAAPFTLSSAGTIDDVAIATTRNAEYSLVIADDIGGLPGAVVGTVGGGFSADGYIEFDPSITLAAGTYWLVMTSDDQGGWLRNDIGANGPFAGSQTGGATWFIASQTVLPAYRVGAARAVPEPGTLAIFSAALLAFGVLRRTAALNSRAED